MVIRARWRIQKLAEASDPQKELRLAADDLRDAARLDPLLDEAHVWLALTSLQLGQDHDEVLRHLGRARLVSRGHAHVNLLAGHLYLDLIGTRPAPHGPEGDSVLAAYREAGALSPQAFSVAWDRCSGLLSGEDLSHMVPDRAHALLTLADHLRRSGDDAGRVAALERAVTAEPRHVVARRALGEALLAVGEDARAAEEFTRAIEQDGGGETSLLAIAKAYREAGKGAAGRDLFRDLGHVWPETP